MRESTLRLANLGVKLLSHYSTDTYVEILLPTTLNVAAHCTGAFTEVIKLKWGH